MIQKFLDLGWVLIPIKPRSKSPRCLKWNRRESAIKSIDDLLPGEGVGLAHAYSGTMCVDIDNFKVASAFLAGHKVDLRALCMAEDAVCIESGVKGRGKLLYKMPKGLVLPSKRLHINGDVYLEFLCASHAGYTLQNVLPPSIHPDTNQAYKWTGHGSFENLPTIPESLLSVWQSLLPQRPVRSKEFKSVETNDVLDALNVIPADISRDEWIRIGMALHHASVSNGDSSLFDVWNDWSATAKTKYPGEEKLWKQWSSFDMDDENPVTLGTLFDIAGKHGYTRPAPDVSHLFAKPVDIFDKFKTPMPDPLIDLWPQELRDMAMHISGSIGCDPLVSLYAGLSAVCAVVNSGTDLIVTKGFSVPPILWLMTIGDPADKKTPGARPMLKILNELEKEDRPRYSQKILEWEAHEAFYAATKKDFLRAASSPQCNNVAIDVPTLQPRPEPLRLVVKDVTSQKLVRLAADNPAGLLCHLDEMASWVKKMTDKGSAEDRSAWVVAYEGDSYTMDRVGSGTISCDRFAVSIYGNIQPDVLRRNCDALSADGLLQRFIPACLRPSQSRLGVPVENPKIEQAYEMMIRRIYATEAQSYYLSPDSYAVYRDFQGHYEQRKKDERMVGTDNTFMTAYGKIEGTCARLILLFHIMEKPHQQRIEVDTVKRVTQLVKSFIIPSLKYALIEITGLRNVVVWVAEKIIQDGDNQRITLADLRRGAMLYFKNLHSGQIEDMLLVAVKQLEDASWLTRLDDGKKERLGYAEWAINPELEELTKQRRERISEAHQRINM